MKLLLVFGLWLSFSVIPSSFGDEHPGGSAEHPGGSAKKSEHPGGSAKKAEHPGGSAKKAEHPGGKTAEHPGKATKTRSYTAQVIKAAVQAHILKAIQKDGGVYKIKDKRTKENLQLKFIKIHNPVRQIPRTKEYFACTDFSMVGSPKKIYDLDFWLLPKKGRLRVIRRGIHKHPVKSGSGWKKKARYTFVKDKPVKIK